MVRIDGTLDPETGETVLTALRSCTDRDARPVSDGEIRSPAQRRADALGEICRQWLGSSDRSQVGGERPHVNLTVDVGVLAGTTGPACELDHVGPVAPGVALRLTCDASVSRILTRGRSEPMDIGRRTPVVPAAMRGP